VVFRNFAQKEEEKTMKKLLAVLLAVAMLLSFAALAACGETQTDTQTQTDTGTDNDTQTQTDTDTNTDANTDTNTDTTPDAVSWEDYQGNGELVAVIFPTFGPEALQTIRDQWSEVMSAHGFNPQASSAELDPAQYVPLIENYVTMSAALLCISPMDPVGIEDIVNSAREAGVFITMLSAQPQYEIDGGLTVDNYMTGKVAAMLLLDFIDKTWPDAEPNSVPVAVGKSTNLEEALIRSTAFLETIEASEKAYVAYQQDMENNTAEAGYNFAEAAMTTNSDIRCFLIYDADQLPGVNNYVMSLPDVDFSEFCAVAQGNLSDLVAELIELSKTDEAIVRGLTAYGGATPGTTLGEVGVRLLAGEQGPIWSYDEIYTINSFGYVYEG